MTPQYERVAEKYGFVSNYPIPVGTVLVVGVLKVTLSTGEMKTLITDVPADEISYVKAKICILNDGVSKHVFNELKHQFEIENLSGEMSVVIEQDFYTTVLLSIMASLIEQDARAEMPEKNAFKTLKYNEYKMNHNIPLSKLKYCLYEINLCVASVTI